MSRPAELAEHDRSHLDELLAACPPLTVLAEQVRTSVGGEGQITAMSSAMIRSDQSG